MSIDSHTISVWMEEIVALYVPLRIESDRRFPHDVHGVLGKQKVGSSVMPRSLGFFDIGTSVPSTSTYRLLLTCLVQDVNNVAGDFGAEIVISIISRPRSYFDRCLIEGDRYRVQMRGAGRGMEVVSIRFIDIHAVDFQISDIEVEHFMGQMGQ